MNLIVFSSTYLSQDVPVFDLNFSEFLLNDSILENNIFLQEACNDRIFIFANYSKIFAFKIEVKNNQETFYNFFVKSMASSLIFEFVQIKYSHFNDFTFFSLVNEGEIDNNSPSILNLKSWNVIAIQSKYIFRILLTNLELKEIIIKNCFFKSIQINNNTLFELESRIILIENSIFISNILNSNLNLMGSLIQMKNVTCFNNNNLNSILNSEGSNCFKLASKIFIRLDQVRIIGCFSFLSAILIINNQNENNNGAVIIKGGAFASNKIQINQNNKNELGGVIHLVTNLRLILENVLFSNNLLETSKQVFAYGPRKVKHT